MGIKDTRGGFILTWAVGEYVVKLQLKVPCDHEIEIIQSWLSICDLHSLIYRIQVKNSILFWWPLVVFFSSELNVVYVQTTSFYIVKSYSVLQFLVNPISMMKASYWFISENLQSGSEDVTQVALFMVLNTYYLMVTSSLCLFNRAKKVALTSPIPVGINWQCSGFVTNHKYGIPSSITAISAAFSILMTACNVRLPLFQALIVKLTTSLRLMSNSTVSEIYGFHTENQCNIIRTFAL